MADAGRSYRRRSRQNPADQAAQGTYRDFDLQKAHHVLEKGGTSAKELRGYDTMDRPCVVCQKPLDQFDFVYIAGGEVDNITPYLRPGAGQDHLQFKKLKRLWICQGCWKEIPAD